jgi:uncharacterized membrane-anchored protein
MPVAKGKKKTKRERRRFGSATPIAPNEDAGPAQGKAAKPVRRRGWEGPLWLNITVGVIMVLAGIIFTVTSGTGIVFLVLYWAVGGFYLYRAYRQYQKKHATG